MKAWVAHRRIPLLCAAIAVVLSSPALVQDFQLDDLFQRVLLLQHSEAPADAEEMFGVLTGDPEISQAFLEAGALPWWSATELKFVFLRPLSTLTHRLDYRLWPDSAVLMHLHSLLWLGLLVWAAGRLYRKLLAPAWVAGLATILFALDDSHGYPAAWLASRNAIISAALGVLALAAFHRWRADRWRHGAWLSALLLSGSLLAGELGSGIVAYFVAYALFLEAAPARERIRSLVPVGLVVAAWLTLHHLGGYGTAGSGYYSDPFAEPLLYLRYLPEHLVSLLGAQFGILPADAYGMKGTEGMLPFALGSLILVAIVSLAMLPLLRHSRTARFWAAGMMVSIVPIAATMPSNRLLFFVSLGGMALIAEYLAGLVDQAIWVPGGFALRAARALGIFLVVAHLVISPILLPLSTFAPALPGVPGKAAMASLPADRGLAEQELVIVNAPDYLVFVSGIWPYLTLEGRPTPRCIRTLTAWPSAVEMTRLDAHTVRLRIEGGGYGGGLGWLFRGPQSPLLEGEAIRMEGFEARLVELTDDARPAVVDFHFARRLESPTYRWVRFSDGIYEPFEPPELGQTARLEAPRGPLEMEGGEMLANYRRAKARLQGR